LARPFGLIQRLICRSDQALYRVQLRPCGGRNADAHTHSAEWTGPV